MDESLSQKRARILKVLERLKKVKRYVQQPMMSRIIHDYGRDPFLILISCLLSLRARDTVSYGVSKNLFAYARTPQELLALPRQKLEEIIHHVGFHRKKAEILQSVSKELIERFNGHVPSNEADLLSIKGIGPKTASLVLSEAFGIPAIAVDTHVQKLAHILGLVTTDNPHQTQRELEKIVPRDHWQEVNQLLVMWGQNICIPGKSVKVDCVTITQHPLLGIKKST